MQDLYVGLYRVLGPHNAFPPQMHRAQLLPEGTVQTGPYTHEKEEGSSCSSAASALRTLEVMHDAIFFVVYGLSPTLT